jgi:hypothetical protein
MVKSKRQVKTRIALEMLCGPRPNRKDEFLLWPNRILAKIIPHTYSEDASFIKNERLKVPAFSADVRECLEHWSVLAVWTLKTVMPILAVAPLTRRMCAGRERKAALAVAGYVTLAFRSVRTVALKLASGAHALGVITAALNVASRLLAIEDARPVKRSGASLQRAIRQTADADAGGDLLIRGKRPALSVGSEDARKTSKLSLRYLKDTAARFVRAAERLWLSFFRLITSIMTVQNIGGLQASWVSRYILIFVSSAFPLAIKSYVQTATLPKACLALVLINGRNRSREARFDPVAYAKLIGEEARAA